MAVFTPAFKVQSVEKALSKRPEQTLKLDVPVFVVR